MHRRNQLSAQRYHYHSERRLSQSYMSCLHIAQSCLILAACSSATTDISPRPSMRSHGSRNYSLSSGIVHGGSLHCALGSQARSLCITAVPSQINTYHVSLYPNSLRINHPRPLVCIICVVQNCGAY